MDDMIIYPSSGVSSRLARARSESPHSKTLNIIASRRSPRACANTCTAIEQISLWCRDGVILGMRILGAACQTVVKGAAVEHMVYANAVRTRFLDDLDGPGQMATIADACRNNCGFRDEAWIGNGGAA